MPSSKSGMTAMERGGGDTSTSGGTGDEPLPLGSNFSGLQPVKVTEAVAALLKYVGAQQAPEKVLFQDDEMLYLVRPSILHLLPFPHHPLIRARFDMFRRCHSGVIEVRDAADAMDAQGRPGSCDDHRRSASSRLWPNHAVLLLLPSRLLFFSEPLSGCMRR